LVERKPKFPLPLISFPISSFITVLTGFPIGQDDLASEVSQGTSIIFSDTQGFFASLFLFVLTFALDVFAYSMAQHEPEYDELEDGWGVSICYL
jgi:CDP-diglyceride synthetase